YSAVSVLARSAIQYLIESQYGSVRASVMARNEKKLGTLLGPGPLYICLKRAKAQQRTCSFRMLQERGFRKAINFRFRVDLVDL
ncbi:MAG: hypothetical protein EAZ28_18315, partial [Oscillatoriales cyanobacterium]